MTTTYSDYYTAYLAAHPSTGCRRLHLLSNLTIVNMFFLALSSGYWDAFFLTLIVNLLCSWLGHRFWSPLEARATGPVWWSLRAEAAMTWGMLQGRLDY